MQEKNIHDTSPYDPMEDTRFDDSVPDGFRKKCGVVLQKPCECKRLSNEHIKCPYYRSRQVRVSFVVSQDTSPCSCKSCKRNFVI